MYLDDSKFREGFAMSDSRKPQLSQLVTEQALKIMRQKEKIKDLLNQRRKLEGLLSEKDKELALSVRLDSIASRVKCMFESGKVPLPKGFADCGRPVEIICHPDDIVFGSSRGISVDVTFKECERFVRLEFLFALIPHAIHSPSSWVGREYPGFHFGYVSPVAKRTRPRRQTAKPQVTGGGDG